jgi:hypothetical protein
MSEIVVAVVAGGLILAFAAVIVFYNWKRVHIARVAANASDEQLESIYKLVEACGSEKPVGCLLARTNRTAQDATCMVSVPGWLEDFPWAGRTIIIEEAAREVSFRFAQDARATTQFLGKAFRAVAVPRNKSKSGKARNVFSPNRYVLSNQALRPALQKICTKYPDELLSYLFNSGAETFEFDPIDQARIGTSPAWVQAAEFQVCSECRRRMALVLQVPGVMIAKGWASGTFYLFGCKQHPEITKTVVQFT